MKCVIVLLVATACVHGMLHKENLKEIKVQVEHLLKNLTAEQLDSVFVADLKKQGALDCKPGFFCQCKKILSGEKFQHPDFQNIDRLKRVLSKLVNSSTKSTHQAQHMENCSFKTTGDLITLHLFLTDLKKCTQKVTATNGFQHS